MNEIIFIVVVTAAWAFFIWYMSRLPLSEREKK